jgi:hypothetical protein
VAFSLGIAPGAHQQSAQRLEGRRVIGIALEQLLEDLDGLAILALIPGDQSQIIVDANWSDRKRTLSRHPAAASGRRSWM